jgi:tRNA nucleotidyltransferase/poly(A) polymerase
MKAETFDKITDYLREVIKGTKYEDHVYAVGGCCRDYRVGREIKDIDLVIDLPDGGIKFAKYLKKRKETVGTVVTYEHFGTAMFHLKEFPEYELEAVQTRKEAYRDMESRNPETAYGSLSDDCRRRDFTYNAIYYRISDRVFMDFNGHSYEDLKNNVLRTCGSPDIIFTEDPLRILRAVRFSSRFGSTIEDETYNGMVKFVDRLNIISRERIYEEFKKMISTGDYYKNQYAICTLWDIGAFKYILPHLHTMKMLDRMHLLNRVGRLCQHYPPKFEEVMAAIMWGYDDAETELRDLKLSNDEIKEILFYINENKTLQAIIGNEDIEMHLSRKVMNECGDERRFLTATIIGSVELYHEFHTVCEDGFDGYNSLYDSIIEHEKEYFTYKLPVDGNDVMEVLGIKPGPEIKTVLNSLMNFAYINKNEKDEKNIRSYLKYIADTRKKD